MLALAPGHAPGTGQAPDCPKTCRPPAASTSPHQPSTAPAKAGSSPAPPPSGPPPLPIPITFPASAVRLDAYDAWLSHVWTAAACSCPVQLRGSVHYADPAAGEVTGTISTDDLPDQAIYKPCGNRRATACPGRAETYRRDIRRGPR
jgi:hypothetical protein